MTGRKVGRPPKYKNNQEITEKIEEYFQKCEGEPLKDKNGEVLLDKFGHPVMLHQKPPTITGMALALGFSSRQALLNYQGKREFNDTITRAKSRIEEYTEERLFDRDGVTGAKFSLVNNFKGWANNPADQENEETGDDGFLNALRGQAQEDWTDEEE